MVKSTLTNDSMIRRAIRIRLALAHAGQDAVIVDELKVSRGSSRMDVAVINGRIEGYEIKSDRDTLQRLARQAGMYGLVADRMTLVVGEKHIEHSLGIIPDWWGIMMTAVSERGDVVLRTARRGRLNKTRDKRALLEALERDEIVALLAKTGLDHRLRTAGYRVLVDQAFENLDHGPIADHVRNMLKVRARLSSRFGDRAFGRNAIICSAPSA